MLPGSWMGRYARGGRALPPAGQRLRQAWAPSKKSPVPAAAGQPSCIPTPLLVGIAAVDKKAGAPGGQPWPDGARTMKEKGSSGLALMVWLITSSTLHAVRE